MITEQILAGVACSITATTIDQYGEPAAAAGTVTVSVTDAAGDAVTSGTVVSTADPVHTAPITVANMPTAADRLTAVWSDDGNVFATNTVEVVGGFYCTVADIRAEWAALTNTSTHPAAALRADRWEVETQVESVCKRAFVPRFVEQQIWSDGSGLLVLPHPNLISVAYASYWNGTGWTAVTGTLSYVQPHPLGWAVMQDSWWPSGLIKIGYRHGMDLPADLKNATINAIRRHRHRDASALPGNATAATVDGMTLQLAVPGTRRTSDTQWVTADPDIDEVINRPGYKWDPPVAG